MISLSPAERRFIRDHLTDDVQALLLRTQPAGPDLKKLAAQLTARQKAREKLPTWYTDDELIFPPALSVEQASSERTAHYKASLVSGRSLLDLTGGMGVDTWAFAQRVGQVTYVEHRSDLAELAAHNLPRLGALNVVVRVGNGLTVADELENPVDWVYLDPHRRSEQGHKVVGLADCEPDVSRADVLTGLLKKTDQILLKTSPLIDIDATIRQLTHAPSRANQPASSVGAVHIVAVQGEVKEVLFVIGRELVEPERVAVTAVNLTTAGDHSFASTKAEERTADVSFGDPQRYIYEPNAAVLKAGAFRLIAARFGLIKLAPNSHLYTSDTQRTDFPGRMFVLEHVLKPDRKTLQSRLPTMKANLTVRNFPQSVADLRKKLGLQEGGAVYILATTLLNGDKRLLVTRKVAETDL